MTAPTASNTPVAATAAPNNVPQPSGQSLHQYLPDDLAGLVTEQPAKPVNNGFSGEKKTTPTTATGITLATANGSAVAAAPSTPVEIPKNLNWTQPKTVVQANSLPKNGGEKALVTFVDDGDSAWLQLGDASKVECRIDMIDAPEINRPKYGKKGQPFGEEAKQHLKDLIENKEVNLRIVEAPSDRNKGRYLCQIEIEGKNISKEMVQAGLAWVYEEYVKDPQMLDAYRTARNSRKGLWSQDAPIRPSYHRNGRGPKY